MSRPKQPCNLQHFGIITAYVYPAPHSCYALHNLLKPLQSTPNYFINDDSLNKCIKQHHVNNTFITYAVSITAVIHVLISGCQVVWNGIFHTRWIKCGVVARILTEGGSQHWPELSHQQCSAGESHCQTDRSTVLQ